MSPNQSWYGLAKSILLTGAGFTKTFGGYLGSEMWAAILNQPEVQQDLKIRNCLLNEPNLSFEAVYDQVLESSNYLPEQKRALTAAVRRAYEQMDQFLRQHRTQEMTACRIFISRFADPEDARTRSFVFTLNQDLFMERFFSDDGDHRRTMRIPGVHNPEWFKFSVESSDKFQVRLPSSEEVVRLEEKLREKGTGQFMYVKLHGSYGWLSQDGSDAMVIGHGKRGRIQKEPLLGWYLSLFKKVLREGDRKLVVIGYGFGDGHINEIIADAIQERGLQLYVICPMEPAQFRNYLTGLHGQNVLHGENVRLIPDGKKIWRGLFGYYPNAVTEFYDSRSASILPPRGKCFFENIGLL